MRWPARLPMDHAARVGLRCGELERLTQERGIPRRLQRVAAAASDRRLLFALGGRAPTALDRRHVATDAGLLALAGELLLVVLGDADHRADVARVAHDAERVAPGALVDRGGDGGMGRGRRAPRAEIGAVRSQVAAVARDAVHEVVLARLDLLRHLAGLDQVLGDVAVVALLGSPAVLERLLVLLVDPGQTVRGAGPLLDDLAVALGAGERVELVERRGHQGDRGLGSLERPVVRRGGADGEGGAEKNAGRGRDQRAQARGRADLHGRGHCTAAARLQRLSPRDSGSAPSR